MLYTSQQLAIWEAEAFQRISREIPFVLQRVSLEVTAGNPFFELPANWIGIHRLTWLGEKVEPVSGLEWKYIIGNSIMTPAFGAFSTTGFSNGFFIDGFTGGGSIGKPLYYCFSGYDWTRFQVYPTPAISVTAVSGDLWSMEKIRTGVILTGHSVVTTGTNLPDWARQPIVLYYVLSKAYAKEGDSQRIDLANYFKLRFELSLEILRKLNAGCFVSKPRTFEDDQDLGVYRKHRGGSLPPDYPERW